MEAEAHLDHWVGLESQDHAVRQATPDSEAHLETSRDPPDLPEGRVHRVSAAVQEKPVPVDLRDHKDELVTVDLRVSAEYLDLQARQVIQDHWDVKVLREYADQLVLQAK